MQTESQKDAKERCTADPREVPGVRIRKRPVGKTEWTYEPWIRVKPDTDIVELLNRAREDQFTGE